MQSLSVTMIGTACSPDTACSQFILPAWHHLMWYNLSQAFFLCFCTMQAILNWDQKVRLCK